MAYLIDSDVFIQAHSLHYCLTVCPAFWSWLDREHSSEKVYSVKRVRKEILERDDDLAQWIKPRKTMFLPTEDGGTYESMELLSTWASGRYQQAAQAKFFAGADFHLISFAHAHKHTVVTHEVAAEGFQIKIPNACKSLDVSCITPFEMLKREGAKFILG